MSQRPLRGLIVGLGSIGRRHARNWAALRLGPLSVCRRPGKTLPEALGLSPAPRVFANLDQALAEQPDIVVVANPTSLHLDVAWRALRAGAHVLVEKPLAHTLEGVDDLLTGAAQQQRHLMVGYNLRFHPGLKRLKELLDQNALGRLVSARAEVGEYLPEWHPWEDYRQSYSARRELGGGPLLTLSHEIDSLCWLLGAPTELQAMTAHTSTLEIDTEDVAEMVLQYAPGPLASVHIDYVRRPPKRSLEVVGEGGVLRWEYEENRLLHYSSSTRQWRLEEGDPRFQRNDMYLAELGQLAACVRGESRRLLVDGEQGAAVLAIALAGLRSAAEGRAVDLQAEGEPVTSWLSCLGRP